MCKRLGARHFVDRIPQPCRDHVRAAVDGLTDAQLDTPYRPEGWTTRFTEGFLPEGFSGVLVAMGDDHTGESSTVCHQSDWAMVDAYMPVLSPAGVQEILDYGLYGYALSRFSGLWAGLKLMKDTVEVTSKEVAQPQFVRFGWHPLAFPNLVNKEGLPAVSFRTDDIPR